MWFVSCTCDPPATKLMVGKCTWVYKLRKVLESVPAPKEKWTGSASDADQDQHSSNGIFVLCRVWVRYESAHAEPTVNFVHAPSPRVSAPHITDSAPAHITLKSISHVHIRCDFTHDKASKLPNILYLQPHPVITHSKLSCQISVSQWGLWERCHSQGRGRTTHWETDATL